MQDLFKSPYILNAYRLLP